MWFYLDTSVAVHAVLPWGDWRARDWLQRLDDSPAEICSSTLMQLELMRVLRRENENTSHARLVLDRLNLIGMDDGILRVAGNIEPHIKSLDAIHLASASLLGSAVTVVTHDANMANVAVHMGFDVLDPLAAST